MSENEHPSETLPADEIGILITRPRAYRRLRALLLLRRSRVLYAELAALTGAPPGADALDIGCGPGDLVTALADRVGARGTVLGIDPAPQMIDHATARTRANCRFEVGAAQHLALPDASVDVITATFVMHHIPQARREDVLANMYRMLRPGGTLLLADTHTGGPVLPTLIRVMSRSAARRTDDSAGRRTDHHGAGHPDPLAAIDIRRYRSDLSRLGFASIEFRTAGSTTGILIARKPG